MMKQLIIFCFFAIQAIAFRVDAQPKNDRLESPIREVEDIYDAGRLGSLNGAMKSCFLNFKSPVYFNVYQETTKMINTLDSLSRNNAMGSHQRVLTTRIFEGKSLSLAQCERIVASDWINFIEQASPINEK